MSTVEEIKAAIDRLSLSERAKLEGMLHGWTTDQWDEQIAKDASTGKLDQILSEVDADIDEDRLEDLP